MPLAEHHELDAFQSGEDGLDEWLKKRVRTDQASGASRVFVVCEENRVLGYYALSSSSITQLAVSGRFRRNMPDPIPVVPCPASDKRQFAAQGLGQSLFRDAAMRVSQAADAIGVRAIFVHAISDNARNFYLALGFSECPNEPMMLVVTFADLRASFGGNALAA